MAKIGNSWAHPSWADPDWAPDTWNNTVTGGQAGDLPHWAHNAWIQGVWRQGTWGAVTTQVKAAPDPKLFLRRRGDVRLFRRG